MPASLGIWDIQIWKKKKIKVKKKQKVRLKEILN